MDTPEGEPLIHEGEYVLTAASLANFKATSDYIKARYGKEALAEFRKRSYKDGAGL